MPEEAESHSQEDNAPRVHNLVYTCPVDHVGTSVFVKGWLIPGKQKRPVILVHDLGETAEKLSDCAIRLAREGYSVYSFDMRGHGQSGRRLGHVPSFQQLALDLLQVVAWVRHKEQGNRPVIIAHGMGSLVALFFARGYYKFCSSMILISPIFVLKDVISPTRRFLIKTLADFFPTMMIPQKLCPGFTYCYDEKRRTRVYPKISTHLANELLNAVSQARKLLQRHNIPTLFLCPEGDKICHYDFLKKIIQKHKHKENLRLRYLYLQRHQILSGPGEVLDQVTGPIVEWLETPLTDETSPGMTPAPGSENTSRSGSSPASGFSESLSTTSQA